MHILGKTKNHLRLDSLLALNWSLILSLKYILYLLFRFNRWHLSDPESRNYFDLCCALANSVKNKQSILDIGCGLGEMLDRPAYVNKVGIDIDSKVIRAAKYRAYFNLQFRRRYLCEDVLANGIAGKYDCILLVNWVHNLPPSTMISLVKRLMIDNLSPGGCIITEGVFSDGYKYSHFWPTYKNQMQCTSISEYIVSSNRSLYLISRNC